MLLVCYKKHYDEAEPVIREAAEYDRNKSAVHCVLSSVLETSTKRHEAEREFREVVLSNTDNTNWHL